MKILVVQPHFDDAVWSVAEHMLTWQAQGHDIVVLTVFGWKGADKERRLAREHDQVMRQMRLAHVEFDHQDDAHGDDLTRSTCAARDLGAMIGRAQPPSVVVMPAGIHHPDHLAVGDLKWIVAMLGPTIWIYEELPYYVLYPGETRDVLPPQQPIEMEMQGHDNYFGIKRMLCQMYASQWAPHLERTVFAPERLWVPK